MEPTNENAAAEVHLLCSKRDNLCAIWALKSFYCLFGMTCPLAIHLQGQSPSRMITRLRQHFPDARLVQQAEADAFVEPELARAGIDRLLALRRKTPFMLKLTDFVLMCRAPRLLLLDSDVLFFACARDLIEHARSESRAVLLRRDVANMYDIFPELPFERFDFHLAPYVNSGIALVLARRRESLPLRGLPVRRRGRTSQYDGRADALRSRFQRAVENKYLQDGYLVSLQPYTDMRSLIARHYAGASRALFTREGLPRLNEADFFRKLNGAK